MDNITATQKLSALAQETRLAIFRALVKAGPEGLNPSALSEQMGLANATLSFHLKELKNAGLIRSRQESRYLYYSTDFEAMDALLSFLTSNCCADSNTGCVISS